MAACTCGTDSRVTHQESELCPACLLRLALEPSLDAAQGEETTRIVGPVGRGPHGSVFIGVRPEDDARIVTSSCWTASPMPRRSAIASARRRGPSTR